MGSHSFEDFYKSGTASLREAYTALVEQATREHGNDPYNGSINTTEGVINAGRSPNKLHTPAEAREIIAANLEALSKWGPCEGIRIMDLDTAPRRTVRKTITLRTSPSDFQNWYQEVEAAAMAAVTLRAGEEIETVKLVRNEKYQDAVTRKYQVSINTVKEKSETRYFITDNRSNGRPREWAHGHATQAEARAALIKQLNAMVDSVFAEASTTYAIVAETRRASGAPLVKATRRVVGLTAEVDVTVYKLPTNPQQGGWLFYGWAAS